MVGEVTSVTVYTPSERTAIRSSASFAARRATLAASSRPRVRATPATVAAFEPCAVATVTPLGNCSTQKKQRPWRRKVKLTPADGCHQMRVGTLGRRSGAATADTTLLADRR